MEPGRAGRSAMDVVQDFLEGSLLIAMPTMSDPRFQKSVIYLCAHSAQGALGIVVNKTLDNITFVELLTQLDIRSELELSPRPVHFGGPVETTRGFVLHSLDYASDDATLKVSSEIGLTATLGILKAIAAGAGPEQSLLALGYAGWAPGQLESEIQDNGWLHCGCDPDIVFGPHQETKWERALMSLGIDPFTLSSTAGHA
ncbi:MAG: YqgE/AlgH family protein [Alphaproteobacteria bacterium]|nr:YqgE/AlgH family protein [Alphaproteobacteria bacterium]